MGRMKLGKKRLKSLLGEKIMKIRLRKSFYFKLEGFVTESNSGLREKEDSRMTPRFLVSQMQIHPRTGPQSVWMVYRLCSLTVSSQRLTFIEHLL